MQSFYDWLATRAQEPPQADRLAAIIAGAAGGGISFDRLRALVHLPPQTSADILRALTATGQVEVVKVGGRIVYRARL
jgi:hypothetical protein